MRLWIVTAGLTDVQFSLGEDERLDLVPRTPQGAASLRAVHEWLLGQTNVSFVTAKGRKSRKGSLAAWEPQEGPARLIDGHDSGISSNCPQLVCPKMEEILELTGARQESLTDLAVVILDTHRQDRPDEPIASGPVLVKYLEATLGLKQADKPEAGKSVVVHILEGNEGFEGNESKVAERLEGALASLADVTECTLFATGGISPVKQYLPWVLHRRYGASLKISDLPENGKPQIRPFVPDESPLLHFVVAAQCVEMLERGDLFAAMGMARSLTTPWACQIGLFAEALYPEFTDPKDVSAFPALRDASPLLRLGLAIELDLHSGAFESALTRIGTLIELAVWSRIKAHPGLSMAAFDDARRTVGADGPADRNAIHDVFRRLNCAHCIDPWQAGLFRIRIGAGEVETWFKELMLGPLARQYADTPRDCRNRLIHGGNARIDSAISSLRDKGAINKQANGLGQHFLMHSSFGFVSENLRSSILADYQRLIRIARGTKSADSAAGP